MAKVLVEETETLVVCGNYLCAKEIQPGELVYPARLRPEVYCSPVCRNRHSRRLVQARRRADPQKNRRDNDKRILRKYGLSVEEFNDLLEKQGHRCASCGDPFDDRRPHVDHCHTHGHVRGLLCSACNVGIGYFYDSPERLRKAIAYLEGDRVSAPASEQREGGDL